jgi:hypothetical protein
MPTCQHTRTQGQNLLYTIDYDDGEYFIQRDGIMKKSVPDALVAGIAAGEASADLMLHTAIADIENLIGMEE